MELLNAIWFVLARQIFQGVGEMSILIHVMCCGMKGVRTRKTDVFEAVLNMVTVGFSTEDEYLEWPACLVCRVWARRGES